MTHMKQRVGSMAHCCNNSSGVLFVLHFGQLSDLALLHGVSADVVPLHAAKVYGGTDI